MFGLSGFKEVDPGYVAEIAAKGAHLIDVRTEAEVAQGVIDGAIHIPLHLLPLACGRYSPGQTRGDLLPFRRAFGAGVCVHGLQGLRQHAQPGRRHHGVGAFGQHGSACRVDASKYKATGFSHAGQQFRLQ